MNIYWEVFNGSWMDSHINTIEFSGDKSNFDATIPTETFQQGTHLVNGAPGIDQCGSHHLPNVKFTAFNKAIYTDYLGTVTPETFISDSNLIGGGTGLNGDFRFATFRLRLNNRTAFSVQNMKLYSFDSFNIDKPARFIDIATWVVNNNMTQWYTLNSDTEAGPAAAAMDFQINNLGGIANNLAILDQPASNNHHYPIVISVSPELAGNKSSCALGIYFEYF